MRSPLLIALLLLVCCFSLAVTVEPKLAWSETYQRHDKLPIEVVLGDARRLFATHFFVKADVYFHSGYYPSIFDQAATNHDSHMVTGAGAKEEKDHEKEADFLGQPLDWIDRLGRAFFPSTHTHLDEEKPEHDEKGHEGEHHEEHEEQAGNVREILPWLRITAALDPSRIETYTVSAYWLRNRMGKPKEAEEFLRDGLRENPGSFAILFELGRIYQENYKDTERARNVWEAALKRWNEQERDKKDPDTFLLLQIAWHLALLEQKEGNAAKAVSYLEIAKTVSPNPKQVQEWIDAIQAGRSTDALPR